MKKEQRELQIVTLMDQGVYIDLIVNSVLENLLYGAVLAIIILLVFLKSIRPTFVIAYSLLASLVVALTPVPMMAAGVLRKTKTKESRFFVKLQNIYEKLLRKALKGKILVLLGALAFLIVSGVLAGSKRTAFMPEMESTQIMMNLETEKGTPLQETAKVADGVMETLKKYDVPSGCEIAMAGEDETIMESMIELLKMLGLAIVFMYLIMVAQFQSLRSPFIIMFTIPLAFTGGLFGLFLSDSPVSVIAMIGFVMLSGIIVNNGIVFVDYTNQLINAGMDKYEALVETGRTRLRPILMTAITTILGLSTMTMGIGTGADMVQPMAIVTVGGLIYGTILTLFVVPCIYAMFHRKEKARLTEEIERTVSE